MTLSPQSRILSETDISKRLFEFAKAHAERLGYAFGDDAGKSIHTNAKDAAKTIRTKVKEEAAPEKQELYIRQAEAALGFLVERMIFIAMTTPEYSINYPGTIGEVTYRSASSLLCPCWPIC